MGKTKKKSKKAAEPKFVEAEPKHPQTEQLFSMGWGGAARYAQGDLAQAHIRAQSRDVLIKKETR